HSLPRRAGLSRPGFDLQRIRPSSPRIGNTPRRVAGIEHGGAGREASSPRRARRASGQAEGDPRPMNAVAELQLLNGLQQALGDQQLHMVYQPKVSLRDGGLRQVEALVRWNDPHLGPVKPSMFVPLAEEHGLIDELTLWGLRTILRQWLDWRDAGLDICIAFNISALSLQHLDFPDL